jgi:hypothetical protein
MYQISLLSIKCLVSQEDDGDEIYITLNGKQVWSVRRHYVMHQQPRRSDQMKEVDFAEGRYLSVDGWKPLPDFDPATVVFQGLTGPSSIQVWDQDNFSRDDYFGKIQISQGEAGRGPINGVAAGDAAHYVVVFEVVAES